MSSEESVAFVDLKVKFKGFVHYIFAILFCMCKNSTCETRKNIFFLCETSFHPQDNQILINF